MTKRLPPLPLLALTLVTLVLGACGYHLRGSLQTNTAIRQLAIQSDANGAATYFLSSLRRSGITPSEKALYRLHILSFDLREQAVASSGGADITEYLLEVHTSWQLQRVADDLPVMPVRQTRRARSYQRRGDQYGSSMSERRITEQEVRTDVADTVVSQIAAISAEQLQQWRNLLDVDHPSPQGLANETVSP